ncbi:hypothetical protein RCH16_000994 [Cryobacterium sp. MP_M5]|uniref:hypothetical protein n=1 Tax=unclassified Cryobacterium TaxID=2649013 RepID=UPI0018CA92EF|nr:MULTISPECIES: hypothetical protein [unclassified Cryobacterium]MBG6057796.1 hypothetical protein [Cryobacterium sp. MP_M3]MEC5175995.1 hypothetical protein [Cryobacterium sp. MP_M5]
MSEIFDSVAAVREAMSASREGDVVQGVKSAVAAELTMLDPDANIVFTDYFNHSYVPDMVIQWRDSGKKRERRIYLRNSLGSMAMGDQAEALAGLEPVMLGLRTEDEKELIEEVRDQFKEAPRAFVTELSAVADLTRVAVEVPSTSTVRKAPILDLVRGSIVRGGRGVLAEEDSRALVESGNDSTDSAEAMMAFQTQIDQLFLAPAASRLHEAIRLIRLGLETDLGDIEALDEDAGLSDSELRVLLPYLLADERVTKNRSYWAAVGGLMDLGRLESIADDLAGLDLTPLVSANVERWGASRAQLTFAEEIEGVAPSSGWRIKARLLAADVGPWTMFLTADQRRLKGRDARGAARWDNLFPLFDSLIVGAVQLQGLSRSVRVEGEKSANVFEDVLSIRNTIQDDFHVPSATVRREYDEENVAIVVDFGAMTASAPNAPVASFVEATRLLAFQSPLAREDIDLLTGRERS